MSIAMLLGGIAVQMCSAEAPAAPPYAIWAHSHFVWLAGGANQSEVEAFLAAWEARNISVGAVNIDSSYVPSVSLFVQMQALLASCNTAYVALCALSAPFLRRWATGYNTFVVNTQQWPSFESFVASTHARGQRVILWMTSMIDIDSPNFAEAYGRGFLVRDGTGQQANLSWWHGKGGLLDYTTPAAVEWWQTQMDNVLRLSSGAGGVDGFKCKCAVLVLPIRVRRLRFRGGNDVTSMHIIHFLYRR